MMPLPPSKALYAFVADQSKVKQRKTFRIAISDISVPGMFVQIWIRA